MLIEDEKAKVDAGGKGNQMKLLALRNERARHLELVALFTQEMKIVGKSEPIDQAGVKELVDHLYNLKHFGKNLEHLKISIAEIHNATNREPPHRVQDRSRKRWTDPLSYLTSGFSYQPTQRLLQHSAPASATSSPTGYGFASGSMRKVRPPILRQTKPATVPSRDALPTGSPPPVPFQNDPGLETMPTEARRQRPSITSLNLSGENEGCLVFSCTWKRTITTVALMRKPTWC
ncbi:hypothetical protein H2198_005549 [Neophaeococcomyces mojaviensis]|uniref:Uncharacterized protein n=1 Tax=Neophaeococcomyces mojaviensis TaxID=3383035 RepID=A0ACC3A5R4_9EURO|nr:hypothetical protein H2198_005549 [Knufia sp. JES_112]